ncbi:MAG TPA: homoserine dehydrogenase [Dehalococcoidia bacterium]
MGGRDLSRINIGLMGLGVVGSGVARILTEKADWYATQVGRPLVLRRALVRDLNKPRQVELPRELLTTDPREILDDDEVHLVIEVMGGEHPAYEYVREALLRGKYVVTANKEVMAKHGPELLDAAREAHVDVLYEASVGGGIPLIAPLKRDLLANAMTSVRAIINGTTNYILTQMSREGWDFDRALQQAQALGYAEPDPTNDVEGLDAAYKIALLASLAFHTHVHPDDVYHEGITRLAARDFRYARELGYAIKLLAMAERSNHGVQVRVHPALIPEDQPLAKVEGVYNAVELTGDLLDRVLFQGPGAGSLPTTSAVVADVIDVALSIIRGVSDRLTWRGDLMLPVRPIADLTTRYYLRLVVPDRAGVLAQIAGCFGRNEISIASVIQKETHEEDQTAELVIMTHRSLEANMQRALRQLAELPVVREVGTFLRVEG